MRTHFGRCIRSATVALTKTSRGGIIEKTSVLYSVGLLIAVWNNGGNKVRTFERLKCVFFFCLRTVFFFKSHL